MRSIFRMPALCFVMISLLMACAGANDLAYLSTSDPWYPDQNFPKLTTPQWVGEDGVEAVVVLAIDDMRDTAKYEAYLRPILQRLKQIDGRAPLSIMTCNVVPTDPQLQSWRDEGLSIEIHTVDHPCPILQGGDLVKAKSTYDRCVDLIGQIPGNKPVAFRTPCCDSLNTVSPRFFSEIFNKTTPDGNFLSLSSSVFSVFTSADQSIPRELVLDANGSERFRRYFPKGLPRGATVNNHFMNWIENYPYPYVINGRCWEFPCMVPSDWEAQYLQKPDNPQTVADMKTALDITVLKQGVYCLVFHPHGWIQAEQVVELIDHAVAKHGSKVKFLNFQEAAARLNENLLSGSPIRASDGGDAGVRIVDLNRDGFMDVVLGTAERRLTRVWQPRGRSWHETSFPVRVGRGVHFTHVRDDSTVSVLSPTVEGPGLTPQPVTADSPERAWHFNGREWLPDDFLMTLVRASAQARNIPLEQNDAAIKERPPAARTWRFVDIDHDGRSEAVVSWLPIGDGGAVTRPQRADVSVYRAEPAKSRDVSRPDLNWRHLPFAWPAGSLAPTVGASPDLFRFLDLDGDGNDDLVASTPAGTTIAMFGSFATGWDRTLRNVDRSSPQALPVISFDDGGDNGFFRHGGFLCWQNEHTDQLDDLTHRVAIDDLLRRQRIEQGAISPLRNDGADADPLAFPLSKTPAQSLATMRTKPGLKIELAAAEPLIRDPVAFDWDVNGRLFVVEMGGYPNGVGQSENLPSAVTNGRVRLLEDFDHDGQYDKATTFLDGLNFPTGIQCWRDGVIVTAAPEILFAADSDGDGTADVRRTLYAGFVEGNQQHRVNGLRWGLDGWLYLANGDSGGVVEAASTVGGSQSGFSSTPVEIRGRDLAIQPDPASLRTLSGQSQFGRERDDFGNWFGCNNSRPMWQYVLEDSYLRRNPHLAVRDTRVEIPEVPGAAPVFPLSRTLARFNDHDRANRFTSACSTMIYRDQLLGEEFAGDAFTCEPVHNLVSRLVIEPDGVSFRGQRAASERESEFLASSDNWFRPVMVRTGPDGALWIADMYRFVIEHPQWIPADWQEKLDLRAGDSLGRIYRIVRKSNAACCGASSDTESELSEHDWFRSPESEIPTAALVSRLASSNGWWRDTAQRLLMHRADVAAVPGVRAMARQHENPAVRVQALATLALLDAGFSSADVNAALNDAHPAVRRQAVLLSERLMRSPVAPDVGLETAIAERAGDSDPTVRLQTALSLGEARSAATFSTLANLLAEHASDSWIRTAALSSLREDNVAAVQRLLVEKLAGLDEARRGELLEVLAEVNGQSVAFGKPGETAAIVFSLLPAPDSGQSAASWQNAARMLGTLRRHFRIDRLFRDHAEWPAVVQRALGVATSPENSIDARLAALAFLGNCDSLNDSQTDRLTLLITPQFEAAVQLAAVSSLVNSARSDAGTRLLSGWTQHSPAVRLAVAQALLGREEWTRELLDAIARRAVQSSELDAALRERLVTHRHEGLRRRAAELLAVGNFSARDDVVAAHAAVLKLSGQTERGRAVFEKRCAVCHRLGSLGRSIGADLAALKDRSSSALLIAILDPNRAVEAKFLSYTAVTRSGRSVTGMLLSEAGNSLTLLGNDGKEQALQRGEIEELVASNRSLMPEGLEKDLLPQDLADVMAFVQQSGVPPKSVEGNQPRRIGPSGDGTVTLDATAAEIYGPTLTLESHFKNLGWWSSADDFAAWTLDLPREMTFDVEFDFACHEGAAGDQLDIFAGDTRLSGRVPSTERWDRYGQWRVGRITLPSGVSRFVVSTPVKPKQALIDLRAVKLSPVP